MVPVDELVAALGSEKPRLKYGASKALLGLAEESPQLVYPQFALFWKLFHGDNTILRWNASRILGHLAKADSEGRIEEILDDYLAPISGPEMIGAANIIAAAADVALAKPELADRIAAGILKVERASYKTEECRNVAIGHAIVSLSRFLPLLKRKKPVMAFVTRQLDNPRPATRKKAEKLLKRA